MGLFKSQDQYSGNFAEVTAEMRLMFTYILPLLYLFSVLARSSNPWAIRRMDSVVRIPAFDLC